MRDAVLVAVAVRCGVVVCVRVGLWVHVRVGLDVLDGVIVLVGDSVRV